MILQFSIAQHDKNRLVFQTDTPAIDSCIRTFFREKNEAARFQQKFRFGGKSDPFVSPITPLGSFRPGLFYDIVSVVQNRFPGMVEIITPQDVIDIVRPCNHEMEIFQPENEKYELRGYQENAVALGAKWGRGVFAHATGSGKSLAMYCLIRSLERLANGLRTLVVVPGVGLVEQLHSDFIEYGCPGYKVQKFCSSSDSIPVADIIIANQEYLQPRKKTEVMKDKDGNDVRDANGRKKRKTIEEIASDRSKMVDDFDLLIVDECQQLKSMDTFIYKYVAKYTAPLKFGFSGSMAESGMSRWNVCGALGPVLDEIQPKELQAAGILAPLNLSVIQFIHGRMPEMPQIENEAERRQKEYAIEWKFIEENQFCNEFVADICNLHAGENSIVLFDHTAHGHILFDTINQMKDKSTKTFYIDGSVKGKDRESIRNYVRNNRDCIIVSNSDCMSTGINIPNLNNMIFAFSYGTDRDKIMQSAGRVLRCAPGKTHAQLYAICHNLKYSMRHVREQLELFDKYYQLGNYHTEKIFVP